MRNLFLALSLSVAAIAAAPATAQEAAAVREGAVLVSADGARLGRVTRVVTNAEGQPVSVALIYRSRFIYVPVSTVTAGDDGRLTTSLTRDELRNLR